MVIIFMNYKIVKGKKENLKECCEILIDSEIGRIYFAEKNITRIISFSEIPIFTCNNT